MSTRSAKHVLLSWHNLLSVRRGHGKPQLNKRVSPRYKLRNFAGVPDRPSSA